MKRNILRIFFLLSAVEGLAALLFLFCIPSMDKNAVALGYSAMRLIFGGLILIPLLFFSWATYKVYGDDGTVREMDTWLGKRLIDEKLLYPITVNLVFCLLCGGGCLYLFSAPVSQHLGMLVAVLERIMSLVAWMMLLAVQGLGLIVWGYYNAYRLRWGTGVDTELLFSACLAPVLVIASVVHWGVYYFRLELFINIPGWFWKFQQKTWSWKDGLIVAAMIAAAVVIWLVMRWPTKTWRNLTLLVVLGVWLQISFGFIDGGGMDSIRQKYLQTDHSDYARQAVNHPDLIETLKDYERLYGSDYYLGTKPPGLMSVYLMAEKISVMINPATINYERYINLTWFIAYVFPWIAMLVMIPLFFTSRRFYEAEDTWLPAIFYISCANVMLMPLFMDQVLYPFLFIGSLFLAIRAIESNSLTWAVIGGVSIFISVYISFSILPVLGMIIVWAGIRYLLPYFSGGKVEKVPITHVLKVLVGLAIGISVMMLIWRSALNYDFFTRYSTAMAQHRAIRNYSPGFRQAVEALVLNNVEFSVWAGFPLIVLFVWRLIRAMAALIRRNASKLDGLMTAFFGSYILLNLLGQTKGEVGRLWIFLLPMVALFSADELGKIFGYMHLTPLFQEMRKYRIWKYIAIILVFALQLFSALVIFHCQDLGGLYIRK